MKLFVSLNFSKVQDSCSTNILVSDHGSALLSETFCLPVNIDGVSLSFTIPDREEDS